ncbi:oligoendopeptidase F family protein [Micromonospora thermarum]|uniref:Oligoendopeptidase F family protein n=1 Tax=Micromonospora thermarum TaxID=2720024 RepID=A0ABX0ZAV8_9ACTN|nr:oligoendopeptidase F family protein [Micromonospora thermarum]NJP33604.1 oligoendopeptidase F family protein [Micromonospora thermarum]
MTGDALVHALLVGLAVGALGRLVLPGRPVAPVWLTLAVGVGAALLGTISARVAGVDVATPSPLRLAIQAGFAGTAVVLAVATAGRAPRSAGRATTRWRPAADPTTVPADQGGEAR